jgi:hypothetical protein
MATASQAFRERLTAQKQRWVMILDPPIHIRKGYYPYDSGIKDNVFLMDISGKPYVGQVHTLNDCKIPIFLFS